MLDDFTGRVGVVTGAGSGIGRALALRLNGLGMRLALLDVNGDGLLETAKALSGPESSGTYVADVVDATRSMTWRSASYRS
jgi:NAD(P)-dependent dehydrogenase (short-subunit alcohol dehydrogenase family)